MAVDEGKDKNTSASGNISKEPVQDQDTSTSKNDFKEASKDKEISASKSSFIEPAKDISAYKSSFKEPAEDKDISTSINRSKEPAKYTSAYKSSFKDPAKGKDTSARKNESKEPAVDKEISASRSSFIEPAKDISAYKISFKEHAKDKDTSASKNDSKEPAIDKNNNEDGALPKKSPHTLRRHRNNSTQRTTHKEKELDAKSDHDTKKVRKVFDLRCKAGDPHRLGSGLSMENTKKWLQEAKMINEDFGINEHSFELAFKEFAKGEDKNQVEFLEFIECIELLATGISKHPQDLYNQLLQAKKPPEAWCGLSSPIRFSHASHKGIRQK